MDLLRSPVLTNILILTVILLIYSLYKDVMLNRRLLIQLNDKLDGLEREIESLSTSVQELDDKLPDDFDIEAQEHDARE